MIKKIIGKLTAFVYGQYFNIYALINPKKVGEKAFFIYCTVRKGRVLPHQASFLDSAKKEVLKTNNRDIQTYHWPGNGKTIVLVHGWESNTFRWRNLIGILKDLDYNIYAFDAPGHGYSSGSILYVPLYASVLQEVITRYKANHVIGHSVGGMTVLYQQYTNPTSNIDKIVTIGSPSEFSVLMDYYQHLLKFNNRVLTALETYITKRFGFTVAEFSTSAYAKTITKKGLLLHDTLDKIAPYSASVAVHKNWKGSKLVSTTGLGHSMHQPEVNEAIVSFLEE